MSAIPLFTYLLNTPKTSSIHNKTTQVKKKQIKNLFTKNPCRQKICHFYVRHFYFVFSTVIRVWKRRGWGPGVEELWRVGSIGSLVETPSIAEPLVSPYDDGASAETAAEAPAITAIAEMAGYTLERFKNGISFCRQKEVIAFKNSAGWLSYVWLKKHYFIVGLLTQ